MGKALIFGHKNPDTDTICSAVAYADLKTQLGIEVEPVRLGEVNGETQFALDFFNVQAPRLVESVAAEAKDVIRAGIAQGFKESDLKKTRLKMTNPKIVTQRQGFGKGARYIWAIDSPMDSMDTHPLGTGTHGTHDESMATSLAPVTPIGGDQR